MQRRPPGAWMHHLQGQAEGVPLSSAPPSWKGLLGHISTVWVGRPTRVQGHVL